MDTVISSAMAFSRREGPKISGVATRYPPIIPTLTAYQDEEPNDYLYNYMYVYTREIIRHNGR
jgi:hypothetical protein